MANREKGNWPPYNVKAIEQNIRLVMRTSDIRKLNKPTYEMIHQHMGFIAHYSLLGFQDEYLDIELFRQRIQTSEHLSRDPNYNLVWADKIENDRQFNEWYGPAYNKSKADAIRAIVKVARTRWCGSCGREIETPFGEKLPNGLCANCFIAEEARKPVCPKCGKPIDYLNAYVIEGNVYSYVDGDYEHREQIDFDVQYYKCPLCHEKLELEDEDQAIAFLVGGKQLELIT